MHDSYAVEIMHLQVYLNLLAYCCHTMSTHATEEKIKKCAHLCKIQALRWVAHCVKQYSLIQIGMRWNTDLFRQLFITSGKEGMLETPSFFLTQNKAGISLFSTGQNLPLCLDSVLVQSCLSAAVQLERIIQYVFPREDL